MHTGSALLYSGFPDLVDETLEDVFIVVTRFAAIRELIDFRSAGHPRL